MILSWWTFLLLIFVFGYSDSLEDSERNGNETNTRKFIQADYPSGQSTMAKAYYSPFKPKYPILAKITPLNENNEPVGESYIGYIYPTTVSPSYYPYFSVLCRKENKTEASDKEVNLEPLSERMKELNEKMEALSSMFIDKSKNDRKPIQPAGEEIDKSVEIKPNSGNVISMGNNAIIISEENEENKNEDIGSSEENSIDESQSKPTRRPKLPGKHLRMKTIKVAGKEIQVPTSEWVSDEDFASDALVSEDENANPSDYKSQLKWPNMPNQPGKQKQPWQSKPGNHKPPDLSNLPGVRKQPGNNKPADLPGVWKQPVVFNLPGNHVKPNLANLPGQHKKPNLGNLPHKGLNQNKEPQPSHQFTSNGNVQMHVFQCEGTTCPEEADSCKITEHAVEPRYEEILLTVFCMKGEQILLKNQNKFDNPSRSSKDSTRTQNKMNGEEIQEGIKNQFESAMKNFNTDVFKNFGNGW